MIHAARIEAMTITEVDDLLARYGFVLSRDGDGWVIASESLGYSYSRAHQYDGCEQLLRQLAANRCLMHESGELPFEQKAER